MTGKIEGIGEMHLSGQVASGQSEPITNGEYR